MSFSANRTFVTVSNTFFISELSNWVLNNPEGHPAAGYLSLTGLIGVGGAEDRSSGVYMRESTCSCVPLQPTFICAPAAQAVRQHHPRPAHNSTLLGSDKAAEGGLRDSVCPA